MKNQKWADTMQTNLENLCSFRALWSIISYIFESQRGGGDYSVAAPPSSTLVILNILSSFQIFYPISKFPKIERVIGGIKLVIPPFVAVISRHGHSMDDCSAPTVSKFIKEFIETFLVEATFRFSRHQGASNLFT